MQLGGLHGSSSPGPLPENGCIQNLSAFTKAVSLFWIRSFILNLTVPFEFAGRVWFIHGNFSFPMVLTKLRQRRIDGDACQPGGKLRSCIEILDMGEGIQKTILQCVFGVFAVSRDPMNDTEDFLDMAFAKLSERSSSPTFGGCDQLVLAPRSKIANRCGITLRRKKCTHHYGEPPPANRGCQFVASSIFFPFHPLADVRRTVLQLHPIRLAIS